MTLKRPVSIKVIVTESFRARLLHELELALQDLDMQEQQLEFQARRVLGELSKSNPKQAHQARTQWEQEKERLANNRRELLERKNQTAQLELNSEFLYAQTEALVEVSVGDELSDKLRPLDVLVRDDVVVAIR